MKEVTHIYHNAKIISMDNKDTIYQAIAINNDEIIALGSNDDILRLKEQDTKITDLKSATMLPGFYDAHGHFVAAGHLYSSHIDLSPPPVGDTRNIEDIKKKLADKAKTLKKGEWIMAYGYDDTLLEEFRHPYIEDIDEVCPDNPVLLRHISTNITTFNSYALRIANITKETPDPPLGMYRRHKNGELNGVVEGWKAFFPITNHAPLPTPEQCNEAIKAASDAYTSRGVTTGQEGFLQTDMFYHMLVKANMDNVLKTRVQIYPAMGAIDMSIFNNTMSGGQLTENKMISLGAVKGFADASIQGYTAFLKEPYYKHIYDLPEGDSWKGYPLTAKEDLVNGILKYHKEGWQIAIHGNGDAAIENILDAFEQAQKLFPREDARHILVHCQMVNKNQLERIKKLGIIPSFFVAHVYYWGDRHRDIFLGEERASKLNPCNTALKMGIPFTTHNDTAITPMDPLLLIWTAVNRLTSSGKVLGADERINVLDAIRSVTSWAAYQAREEKIKGSLEVGKLADMVILKENPLEVNPLHIKDIEILATIVGNNVVYGNLP